MQLKDEFRTYENLRRQHDLQVVQIAFEAGLRISPEQWSSLLYGDASKKSHMQSIIDKVRPRVSDGVRAWAGGRAGALCAYASAHRCVSVCVQLVTSFVPECTAADAALARTRRAL